MCSSDLGLLLLPLWDTRSVNPHTEYEHDRQLFLLGQLAASQDAAERDYVRFLTSDAGWSSRFHLQEAESMVWRGFYQDALRILNGLQGGDGEDRVRTLTLESVALAHLHQLSAASDRIVVADKLCEGAMYADCGGVLRARGILAMEEGDLPEARRAFLASFAFARQHRDSSLETSALLNLGSVSLQNNHYDEAVD